MRRRLRPWRGHCRGCRAHSFRVTRERGRARREGTSGAVGGCPPVRKRCRCCRPGRLARTSDRDIADAEARLWDRSHSAAMGGPLGSHARGRRADVGNQGCSREARTHHTERGRGDLPSGHYGHHNVHAQSIRSQRRFGHASGSALSWNSFVSCFLVIGLSIETAGIGWSVWCRTGAWCKTLRRSQMRASRCGLRPLPQGRQGSTGGGARRVDIPLCSCHVLYACTNMVAVTAADAARDAGA
jgi:hypothetical protein